MRTKMVTMLCGLMIAAGAYAQEEGESRFESTCEIHIKSAVYPSDPFDQSGKARVYITLCTKEGAPIPDQVIELTATCGTFSCKPLDSEDTSAVDSSIYECDHTDKNGKAMVYLVNIPFNNKGSVTAACGYGSLSVKASCTFLISRYALKNKRKK